MKDTAKERIKKAAKSRPFMAGVGFLIGSAFGQPALGPAITALGCALVGGC